MEVPLFEEADFSEPKPKAKPAAKKSAAAPTRKPSAAPVAMPMKPPQYKAVKPVAVAPKKKKKSSKKSSSSGFPMTTVIVVSSILFVAVGGLLVYRSFKTTSELHAVAASTQAALQEPPANRSPSYTQDLVPFVKAYCSDCHANGSQEGDFAFDRYASLAALKNDREIWAKVLKLVRLGAMPPSDAKQPTEEERNRAIGWLDHQLYFVDCAAEQNPGRVTVRRLNRIEYNNTVNDLLGINFRPADDFPSDDVGHGFDNIGDVLTVPPLLMEKYLTAGESIARKVTPTGSPSYARRVNSSDKFKGDAKLVFDSSDGKVIVSTGQLTSEFNLPRAGQYKLRVTARQDRSGKEDAKMEVKFAGKSLKTVDVKKTNSLETFEFPLDMPGGKVEVAVLFLNDFYDKDAKKEQDRNLHVGSIEIEGPFGMSDDERKKLPLVRFGPVNGKSVSQAAQENLKDFLPKAFRRSVSQQELERYAGLVDMAVKHGETFDEGMGVAVQAVLISPHFLFRVEGGRRVEGQVEMLDDYALASRLSYFLWSSMPDDELFQLAKDNKLHEPEVLKQQTDRMLKDPRSNALVANFAGQWLGLRKLTTNEVDPDAKLFPDFNKDIRMDFWKETEQFFGSIVRSDASIYDLLDGKYTFLNERLAKFYGIGGVTGPEFRRVDLKDQPRAGVLTQGSILTLTSFPNRTSPVKRGEWVLSNILGDAPPDPPPLVPAIDSTAAANPNLTFRQQLELHRADPGCASCHKEMDAIGFGMQTFDAIGRFRTQDANQPIDATGTLPSGEAFNGTLDLIGILRKHKTKFGRCLTEKMMTYSIGRGVDWYDKCAIDKIMGELESNDRMSTLIQGIVHSAPFQSRKFRDAPINESQKSVAAKN
ncbi:DUF1592 domain-containing protein [Planctomicrobium piriforme]|uniref:DUF1592 domain-containing protein n=1 Tax=Planctomicrobium piriforme TaxID=1576369 RepID=UPI001C311E23|nr:DUF1592 domain-containing protein [Planctomicrobium piriforme]